MSKKYSDEEFLNRMASMLDGYFGQRSHNADIEALQRQFPAIPFLPLSNNPVVVAATSANYTEEIAIPSGAQLMLVSTNNGVFIGRGDINFPIVSTSANSGGGSMYEYCGTHRFIWCRGLTTLSVGLLYLGDIATFSFYTQLNVDKLISDVRDCQ